MADEARCSPADNAGRERRRVTAAAPVRENRRPRGGRELPVIS
jgi:hypothetical protein